MSTSNYDTEAEDATLRAFDGAEAWSETTSEVSVPEQVEDIREPDLDSFQKTCELGGPEWCEYPQDSYEPLARSTSPHNEAASPILETGSTEKYLSETLTEINASTPAQVNIDLFADKNSTIAEASLPRQDINTSPEDCHIKESTSQQWHVGSAVTTPGHTDTCLSGPISYVVSPVQMEDGSLLQTESLPGQTEDFEIITSDTEPALAQCDALSEMYYTASSEVSLLSDSDHDKVHDDHDREARDDRKGVIAGHVAAMRERFENMTRSSTPCLDIARCGSPTLELFKNRSPTPDEMNK